MRYCSTIWPVFLGLDVENIHIYNISVLEVFLSNLTITNVMANQVEIHWIILNSETADLNIVCHLWNMKSNAFVRSISCSLAQCLVKNLNSSTTYQFNFVATYTNGESQELIALTALTSSRNDDETLIEDGTSKY